MEVDSDGNKIQNLMLGNTSVEKTNDGKTLIKTTKPVKDMLGSMIEIAKRNSGKSTVDVKLTRTKYDNLTENGQKTDEATVSSLNEDDLELIVQE
jgi:hypothetical protein